MYYDIHAVLLKHPPVRVLKQKRSPSHGENQTTNPFAMYVCMYVAAEDRGTQKSSSKKKLLPKRSSIMYMQLKYVCKVHLHAA